MKEAALIIFLVFMSIIFIIMFIGRFKRHQKIDELDTRFDITIFPILKAKSKKNNEKIIIKKVIKILKKNQIKTTKKDYLEPEIISKEKNILMALIWVNNNSKIIKGSIKICFIQE